MLVQYKYELISFIANEATVLSNNNLRCSLSSLKNLLGAEITISLKELEQEGLVLISGNSLEINTVNWVNFFIDQINKLLDINKLSISGEFDSKNLIINFNINNVKKGFKVILNEELSNEFNEKIYFYKPIDLNNGVYWLDLLNDINTLYLFYEYLENCADSLNKKIFNKFKNLNGLSDEIISEIFNISIKRYFESLDFEMCELNKEQQSLIYKLFENKDIDIKAIEIGSSVLCIINFEKNFEFIELKGVHLTNSENVKNIILEFKECLNKKISDYRKISLSKDNKILDNNIKIGTKTLAIFSPISTMLGLVSFFNTEFTRSSFYRFLLIIAIIILAVLQGYIIKIVIEPLIKLNKFNWDLEE